MVPLRLSWRLCLADALIAEQAHPAGEKFGHGNEIGI